MATLILSFGIGVLAYKLLVRHSLEQTAALFIGLPTVLSLALALSPKATSTAGIVFRGITLCLLMSAPVLEEGFICILLASPLFIFIGGAIILFVNWYKKNKRHPHSKRMLCIALLPLGLFSLEGVTEELSFSRVETVVAHQELPVGVDAVEQALAQKPRFNKPLPFYLQLGFPVPVEANGSGLAVGDRRTIRFAGGEGEPGTLTVLVSERRDGYVRFEMISDTSHIAHWLEWTEAEVRWKAIGTERTAVSWTLHYHRQLDPAWYFGPWERYGVRKAADYLIESLARPYDD